MDQMEFIEAAKRGDLVQMRHLEMCQDNNHQINVNFQCPPDGNTALFWAACCGHVMTCDWLIRRGARVNLANHKTGSLPLHGAADRGHSDCVRLLIRSGRKLINQGTTSNGDTPLHLAAYRGHEDVCRLLLRHGASTSAVNKQGRTALDEARIRNNYDVFQLLCKHYQDSSKSPTSPTRQQFSNTCEMFQVEQQRVAEENDENLLHKMLTVPVYLPSSTPNVPFTNTHDDKVVRSPSLLAEHPNPRLRLSTTHILTSSKTTSQREMDEAQTLDRRRGDVIVLNGSVPVTSPVSPNCSNKYNEFNNRFIPECPTATDATRCETEQPHCCSTGCQERLDCCRQYDEIIRKLCGKLSDMEAYVERLKLEQEVRDDRLKELERLNKALTTQILRSDG